MQAVSYARVYAPRRHSRSFSRRRTLQLAVCKLLPYGRVSQAATSANEMAPLKSILLPEEADSIVRTPGVETMHCRYCLNHLQFGQRRLLLLYQYITTCEFIVSIINRYLTCLSRGD
ncbi:hypothetical protein F444_17141 [Phytophthora nicotianae P1976]|uniref:Uncharacterized protein n=1 Tax=Phytophthora nicotianae P1976 TaxID=1317066 RepID=A0A080ZG36_PHYNI|nr:hypothetical protein F444_17141 [Phytophthora nicotianae P1976]